MQNHYKTEGQLLLENGLGWTESEYRATIDSMSDSIHMVDANLRIILINNAFKELMAELGLPTEAVGRPLFEVYSFLPAKVRDEYHHVFRTGKSLITEEHHTINGKEQFVEVRKIPVLEGKKVTRVVTIVRDFIERRQAEEATLREKVLSDWLIESSIDGILAFDLDCRYTIWNPGMERISGMRKEDALGRCAFDVFPFLKVIGEDQYFFDALAGKSTISEARPYKIPETDKEGFFEGHYSPLRDDSGKIIGGIALIRDITERKLAEISVQGRERFLSGIFNSIQDGLSILDTEMNIIQVNPTIENWYSHAMPLVGRKCYEAYHCRNKPCDVCPTKRTLKTLEASYEEVSKSGLGGEIVGWLDLFSFPLFDSVTGEVKGVIEYVRDITKRKEAEKELKHRVDFERLITTISTNFVNMPQGSVDKQINEALKLIGEFCEADRSYIFQAYNNQTKAANTYEWCAKGIEPQKHLLQELSAEGFPWITEKLKSFKVINISSISDLPFEASAEKQLFQSLALKSVVIVPLVYAGETKGFLGLDAVKQEKAWPEDTVDLLKIIGEVFANALERTGQRIKLDSLNKKLLESNARLKKLVVRDSLTGLYNHRYLSEIIEVEFYRARRYANSLSVIMLDIDYFKSINDVYGHQFGDLVLKQFAKQLRRMLRQYDIIIRYGGEEFVIVSPGTDKSTILLLAQRLLDAINVYNFGNEKHIVKLKLSMAIASYPEDRVARGMDLIELTDQILNKVKEYGGNKVYSYIDIRKESELLLKRNNQKHNADINFLKNKIEKLTKRASQSLVEAILAFAKTIELKDHYTGEHVEKTVHYAREVAAALKLSPEEIDRIGQASILHDLGKIGISEKILLKKSRLTKKEFEEIKKHPQIGVDIIRPIQFLHGLIPFLLYHHERWDGKGYPHGLKGEEIPIGARIVAIADVYQSLTSQRPYRKAYSKDEAIKIIKKGAGTQFDPRIVNGFLSIIQKEN